MKYCSAALIILRLLLVVVFIPPEMHCLDSWKGVKSDKRGEFAKAASSLPHLPSSARSGWQMVQGRVACQEEGSIVAGSTGNIV